MITTQQGLPVHHKQGSVPASFVFVCLHSCMSVCVWKQRGLQLVCVSVANISALGLGYDSVWINLAL